MSLMLMHDEMRPLFSPLLADLCQRQEGGVLVAGGYGLFLKQSWLLKHSEQPTVVPISQWLDSTPRVTKDLDLVVGLEVISNESAHRQVLQTIEKHGFKASEKNPRWQFIKELPQARRAIVELHAQVPTRSDSGLAVDRIRVKRKPSLGAHGFHARTNPEAIGSMLHPFRFEVDGMTILVPNPITWSIMKLTAADDRWKGANDPDRTEEFRSFSRAQAAKHAQDVCRMVAMVGRDESDATPPILETLRTTAEFQRAAKIVRASFANDGQWGVQMVSEHWRSEDLEIIRSTLGTWFAEIV